MSEIEPDSRFPTDSFFDPHTVAQSIPAATQYVFALSGGLDSIVLLNALLAPLIARGASCKAVHVHHGLSEHADNWAAHCRFSCDRLSVPVYVEYVRVEASGEGLEAAARKHRYAALQRHASADSVILLGHHLDDQIETTLMRILKDSNVTLLAGMPQQRSISLGVMGSAKIFRPFIHTPRLALEHYAQANQLDWVEDESNSDLAIMRNNVRHCIRPRLNCLDSTIDQQLIILGERASQLSVFQKNLYQQVRPYLLDEKYASSAALSVQALKGLADSSVAFVLREWLIEHCVPQPSVKIFSRVFNEVILAKQDAQPFLQWGDVQLRRYRGALFIRKSTQQSSAFTCVTQALPVSFVFSGNSFVLSDPDGACMGELCTFNLGEEGQVFWRQQPTLPKLGRILREGKLPPWRWDEYLAVLKHGKLIAIYHSETDCYLLRLEGAPTFLKSPLADLSE
jgi:tRNA(Ile)-lysidine synthase